jgi:hypothetical protein
MKGMYYDPIFNFAKQYLALIELDGVTKEDIHSLVNDIIPVISKAASKIRARSEFIKNLENFGQTPVQSSSPVEKPNGETK